MKKKHYRKKRAIISSLQQIRLAHMNMEKILDKFFGKPCRTAKPAR